MVMKIDARSHARTADGDTRTRPPAQRAPHQQATRTIAGESHASRIAQSVRAATGPEAVARFRPWILDRVPMLLIVGDLIALLVATSLTDAHLLPAQVLAVGTLATYQSRHLFRTRVTLALSDDLLALLVGVAVGAVVAIVVARAASVDVSVAGVVSLAVVAATAIITMRALVYGGIRTARRRGWVSHRAIVVGTDETAARLAATLEAHPDHGLRVVGFVGRVDRDTPGLVRRSVLGRDPSTLPVLTSRHRAHVVLMTLSGVDGDDVLQSLRTWGPPGGLTIFMVPPLFHLFHSRALDRVRDIALVPIRTPITRRLAWRVKALFDTAVAAALLLLLAPVLLAVAAAVRWETGPGVLFRQTRVGLGGRTFTLFKFRSLRPATENESARNWSVADDDRLGPVGRFIRKSSLDELPQLINIIRGEMSLVGPRPERPYFVEQFGDEFDGYALRHRVRPGLTGWAAVNGLRGDTCIQERAYFDNVYIDSWSLQFDFKILALTALSVVKGTGA